MMNETERDDQTIAGLFCHIMELRQAMEHIASTTQDKATKFQLTAVLQRHSLRMPEDRPK